ncbi:MAG: hypothetical protein ISS15_05345 [Alphaproteobacteria bacterium]|nr:hypothetical protein [Alphaproteobacteria bacterium]MBL6939455.1 hypothetical protein [Alphaproteobacteria bacterium]MBL7097064.1 hypothetical protein [Alphaproteobacteria bacterium]
MIRLSLKTEPFWLDLPAGVRVQVKPLDMTIYDAAIAEARKSLPPLSQNDEDTDISLRTAIFNSRFAIALGNYGIVGWEGVGSEDGSPAPVDAVHVEAFMRVPAIGSSFLRLYSASAAAVVAAGNA